MGEGISTLPPLRIGSQDVEGYLSSLEARGRRRATLAGYAPKLRALLDFLPDGSISSGTLGAWRNELLNRGYSPATANSYLSAANGLVASLGRRDLQLSDMPGSEHSPRPSISRQEYLQVLSCAHSAGRKRDYLLVKSMALLGLTASSLSELRVESLGSGSVRGVPIPVGLVAELQSYVEGEGLVSGPIFGGRDGSPLSRSAVASVLRSLAEAAEIAPERLSPGALSSLRKEAIEAIEGDFAPLVEHVYDSLLATEQMTVGWGGDVG